MLAAGGKGGQDRSAYNALSKISEVESGQPPISR